MKIGDSHKEERNWEEQNSRYKELFSAWYHFLSTLTGGGKYNLERELCRIYKVDSIKDGKVPRSVQGLYVVMMDTKHILEVSSVVRVSGEMTVKELVSLEKAMESNGKNEDGTDYIPPAAFKDIWLRFENVRGSYETRIKNLGDSIKTAADGWEEEKRAKARSDTELNKLRGKLDKLITDLEAQLGEDDAK